MGDRAVLDAGLDEKSPIPSRASPTLEDDGEAGTIAQLPKLESGSVSEAVLEPTARMKYDALFQFFTLCFSIFVPGFNDGTLGPLLPRIQAVYHVSPLSFMSQSVSLICFGPRRSDIRLYRLYFSSVVWFVCRRSFAMRASSQSFAT